MHKLLKLSIFTALSNLVSIYNLQAQINVPVDQHTGKAIVSIPLYTVQSGDVILPIQLNYNSGGVKVEDTGGDYGVGWNLSDPGSISRVVRDLPDDFKGTGTRTGWLTGTNRTDIKNVSLLATDPCNGQNYTFVNTAVLGDTEPDVFNFNFGGVSGQFIFDNDKIIQVLPYQDIKIEPIYGGDLSIVTFIVTANNGFKYTFSPVRTVTETVIPNVPINGDPNEIYYLKSKPEKYQTAVTYVTKWGLTNISSPSGGTVSISYLSKPDAEFRTFKYVYLRNADYNPALPTSNVNSQSYRRHVLYRNSFTVKESKLTTIAGAGQQVTFDPSSYDISISFKSVPLKSIAFTMKIIGGRRYLETLREWNGTDYFPPYTFNYQGVEEYTSVLPNPATSIKEQDYWGYYNANLATTLNPNLHVYPDAPAQERYRLRKIDGFSGSYVFLNGGFDRNANPLTVASGALTKIGFPTGGHVAIEYETNRYFDEYTSVTYDGGGIRTKKVTFHDGLDVAHDMIKEYTYTGGRLVNRPQFAFGLNVFKEPDKAIATVPGNLQYEYLTARTEEDLNPYINDDPNVIYQFSEEKQKGKGKVVSEFTIPATFGSITSGEYISPNNWEATYSKISRSSNPATSICATIGKTIEGYSTFPYPPHTNYNFERGLLKSVKDYNQTGQLLRERIFDYTPIYKNISSTFIYGLAVERFKSNVNDQLYSFGRYKFLAGISKLRLKETEILYDPTDLLKSSTTETNYYYSSPNHRMLSATATAVKNDGINQTIYRKRYKYPQDYPTASVTGDMVTSALSKLQTRNINNVLVEQASTIQKPSETEKVISASLKKFATFTFDRVYPAELLELKTNAPLSTFVESGIQTATTFTNDARYRIVSKVVDYSNVGIPKSVQDESNNIFGRHYEPEGLLPLAAISNATAKQVIYSNFDIGPNFIFSYPNGFERGVPSMTFDQSGQGKIGGSVTVPSGFIFQKIGVEKGLGKNAIFSCWIKSGVDGVLTITLTDASANTSVKTINYSNMPTAWVLYEVKVPVTLMNATFDVNVQANSAISCDEMLFYPEMSQVSLNQFKGMNKIAETSMKWDISNYEYDEVNRLKIVRDKDGNILKHLEYEYNDNKKLEASIEVTSHTDITRIPVGATVNFKDALANYTWNADPLTTRAWAFGDGTPTVTGTTSSHVFSSPGTYMIKITLTHPYITTPYTKEIQIIVVPVTNFLMCVNGIIAYNVCTSYIEQLGSCNGAPPVTGIPVGTNTFSATITSSCGGTYTYKWEKAWQSDPDNWETLAGTGSSITVNVAYPDGTIRSWRSYKVRCTVIPSCPFGLPVSDIKDVTYFKTSCQENPYQ